MLILTGIFAVSLELILLRSKVIYDYYKTRAVIVENRVYQYDPELGSAPIPGSQTKNLYPDGYTVPIRFDQNGFRVPLNTPESNALNHPSMLVLGCSYSFGLGCPAEKTYPYLVGQQLKMNSLNAAYPGYGLAQMLILAKRLIPKYKPDFVLVQFSPWLADRPQNPISPWSYIGTSPFFIKSNDGKLTIHPPVFKPKISELNILNYHYTPKSTADYLSFMKNVGIPFYISDGANLAVYYFKRLFGIIPKQVNKSEEIVDFVYEEIERLCEENHAQMVIVIITDPGTWRKPSPAEIEKLKSIPNTIIVNTEPALLNALPVKTKSAYDSAYRIWHGSPPVCIDIHPNETAHQIIAAQIIQTIKNTTC